MSNGKILSIQSHVVHGYVGNRAAVFPLQLLDFEVDNINSVQFSNQTGYKSFRGQRVNAADLSELFLGLKENELLNYTHILTGYVGNVEFLNKLADIIEELKNKNPDIVYLCDPVLGDNGQLYVPEGLVKVYIDRVIPMANIITPNLFELELIYGKKINKESDIIDAIKHCHDKGTPTVIVSSSTSFNNENSDNLCLYASSKESDKIIRIEFDRLAGSFAGTGDAFAAQFLAWNTILKDLKSACEHTISAMLHILNRTNETRSHEDELIEMKLVQSKRDIENPKVIVTGVLINK